MITIEKTIPMRLYPDDKKASFFDPEETSLFDSKKALFFDIETTGLSKSSSLYLIGMLYSDKDGFWIFKQLFLENILDESKALREFFSVLKSHRTLITYNGEGFDIPFLQNLSRQYFEDFPEYRSLDLYKSLLPYKKILSMQRLRLKDCERRLGIFREDSFDGGELIPVYKEWQMSHEDGLLRTLLLHNEEDILNLPLIPGLLSFFMLSKNCILSIEESFTPDPEPFIDGLTKKGILNIKLSVSIHFPFPLAIEKDSMRLSFSSEAVTNLSKSFSHEELALSFSANEERALSFSANEERALNLSSKEDLSSVTLSVPVYEGTLKLFLGDIENYYYFPDEDIAIHKSLSQFLDRKKRKKATRSTCFQKHKGCFIPNFSVFSPVFLPMYKSPLSFSLYEKGLFSDAEKTLQYIYSSFGFKAFRNLHNS